MAPDSVDVEAYCAHIGYTGALNPTLETLAGIHFRHPQAIAFENLDPLLQRPISLDRSALERKMIHEGRGGWCFEQNLLLREVLTAIGFRVTGFAARVMWNVPQGVIRPRTHMLLKIEGVGGGAGAAYIADVGFGGLTLTAPLRLETDVAQATPHEPFRLVKWEGDFILEALVRATWKPLYSFDLQPQRVVDYELYNWYLANHPDSPFVNNLLAARVTPDRRYNLFNNRLSTHPLQGESQQVVLSSPAEMRDALGSTFGIDLPDDPGMEALLARLVARAP